MGFYTDANIVPHGFLRSPDGEITSFDAPGAGLGHGLDQGTVAYAINDPGVIAGQFEDSGNVYHGFVRYRDGSFTTIDAHEAGTGPNQGTWASNVNLVGTTAGFYVDSSGVEHGFIRTPNNEFTSVDPAGSSYTYICQQTCLALDGTVVGTFEDASGTHGFARAPGGTITQIDVSGAISTNADSINLEGAITGVYLDASFVLHGFVRSPNGTITPFNDPKGGAGPGQGTGASSINLEGAVTGAYFDTDNVLHGFGRDAFGNFTNFSAPDGGAGAGQGTHPSTNNAV